MRIIAGQLGGRSIVGPRDAGTTRPMTDRVKTALFDRLSNAWGLLPTGAVEDDQREGVVLDIFAGTGTLGLEALSRGAVRCVFVEQDREARRRLQQNLADLDLADRAEVLAINALRPGWPSQLRREPVRIALMDPPYALPHKPSDLERLHRLIGELAGVAEPRAVCMLRTEKPIDPGEIPPWQGPRVHRYGRMALNFYQMPAPETDPAASLRRMLHHGET